MIVLLSGVNLILYFLDFKILVIMLVEVIFEFYWI